jgi:hypothetical protein
MCIKRLCKRESYFCHYNISGYHGKELSNVNMLQECKLSSNSRMSWHSFVSAYRVCSISTDYIVTCMSDYRRGLDW